MKKIVYILLYILLISPSAFALQGNGSLWSINMYQSNGAISQNLTKYDVQTGQGQSEIGRAEGTSTTALLGIFYMANGQYTLPIIPALYYLFQIADYGMEWVKINWTTS